MTPMLEQLFKDKELAQHHPVLSSLIKYEFWKRGELSYKFKKCQREMDEAIEKCDRFKYVIKCARRLGKSFFLVSRGIKTCRRKEKAIVRYAAPTQKMVRKIIRPLIEIITADCPLELRPIWNGQEGMYLFPGTRSEFHVAGVNSGHADDLRGTACDDFIIDEAGSVTDLHYLVHDVAMPQFLDPNKNVVKGRRLLIASSPARSPSHDFTTMASEAEVEGNYSHYTIFDGEYPAEVIKMFLEEDGVPADDVAALLAGNLEAIKSTTVRREYLAQDVVDENFALCPEWTDSMVQDFQTDDCFQFYAKYDALDIGVRDFTACLFAHYDFKQAKLFIHDEVVMNGPKMTTELIAESIRTKESQIWGNSWTVYEKDGRTRFKMIPQEKLWLRRISDIDLLLINDMSDREGLYFEPTDKGMLEQMVNEVRVWVSNGRIVVHPRCKQVIGCLKSGVWNEQRTQFERSVMFGHFDAFAALMYLVRNVDVRTNPVPITFKKSEDEWFFVDDPKKNAKRENIKKMFNVEQNRRKLY